MLIHVDIRVGVVEDAVSPDLSGEPVVTEGRVEEVEEGHV